MNVHGFRVFIDESGDEGFVFRNDRPGSSHWFVLSAAIVRSEEEPSTVRLVDELRATLGRGNRDALHFRNLKHEHRLPVVSRIAAAPITTVSVLVHKPSILEPEKFSEAFMLYRYATRYLLERVSWYCRDHAAGTMKRAEVVFSHRATMSYQSIRDYLETLRDQTGIFDVRIDWDVVDPGLIRSLGHDKCMGLQIADAIASSFYFGLEKRIGFCEPRYAQMLAPRAYTHRGRTLGYGVKLWPRDVASLAAIDGDLGWVGQCFK